MFVCLFVFFQLGGFFFLLARPSENGQREKNKNKKKTKTEERRTSR
jgi:hypothetical protein